MRMCVSPIATAVLLAVVAPPVFAAGAPAQEIAIACDSAPTTIRLSAGDAAIRFRIDAGPGWLQLEESGQQIRTTGSTEATAIRIGQPLRLGQEWLPVRTGSHVSVRRAEPDSAAGSVRATLQCTSPPDQERRIDWLRRLSLVEAQIDSPVDRNSVLQTVPVLQQLELSAIDERSHALAIHLRAMTLSTANDAANAAREFARAERSWRAAGESERARAAQLGRIESEFAAGDRSQVIKDTDAIAGQIRSLDYIGARMLNERCRAFEYFGQFDQAAACYEPLLKRLQALDERAEYINTLGNFANTQRKLGRLDLARALALRGLDVQGPNAPMMRGRMHQLLSAIGRQQGDVASALGYIEAADGEYAGAGSAALSARASLSLDEAILFEQIGSYAEAYAGLRTTFALYAPAQQLALRAKIFSDLEADTRHYQSAAFWARIAEESFARDGLAPARDATRLDRMRLLLRLGDVHDVETAVAEDHDALPLYRSQWELLAAELALQQNRVEAAGAALDRLRGSRLTLRDQLRYAATAANYAVRSGAIPTAQRLLLDTARRTSVLARRAGSSVLRQVVARQALSLRRQAFDLALDPESPSHAGAIATIWNWLALDQLDVPRVRTATASAPAEAFDRAVAAELLPSLTSASAHAISPPRALISVLAEPGHDSATGPLPLGAPIENLQRRLGPGDTFVALVDGDTRGAVLWVTTDAVRLVATAPPAKLHAGAAALNSLLRSPDSPVGDIQAAARELSAALLGGLNDSAAPARLYVLSNESLNGIAWNLLSWPGSSDLLLATSSVGVVHIVDGGSTRQIPTTDQVRVLLASQQAAGETPLPALAGAPAEADLIRSALTDQVIVVSADAHATRASMLDALAPAGAWVHVAAHGTAEPQRIGFAGVWLEGAGDEKTPAFLSWLDILDHGVGADLVVLDACQSGDAGAPVVGNLSFADAVSRAGANHVVAALWPVSDSAAALWVPAFYQALTADPGHDAAQALRAAQQRLRSSRAFTHPFYWAGLQAIERLDVAAPVPAASH
jgi:CHAT domain